ncbi:D-Ala-D-Ala carboxypeptidase family metallohydrolase [Rhizobium sp. TRM96647]|uniref:YcbK family protein n=1 Tax=unclassified Rhizobium TaxID=2613769 RepID=UPI0021E7F84F|nr:MULTISPECIES: D-Ala-D-Ala carboxypeptidase family metallohydrolase [unclassified Rhizobium]MCV3739059.1 D-Ala-D-Ala carboxypeptidase family metallohydrolase [Rhizobium sp. TRM96647]MCV3760798.1 D-Ala-D-Ala carboxypeptidase family metallohydrolase [Rhizobium sp. TRM96650]
MGRHATRLRNGLLMAVSALVLNGCVSASGDMQSEDDAALSQATSSQQEQAQAGEDGAADGYRDPLVNAGRGSAGGEGPSARSATGSDPSEPSNFADAVMQPAQVNANQTSIFASAAPAASSDTPAGADPDPSGRAITNLYQANLGALPASGATTGSIPAASGSPAAPGTPPAFDEEASVVPDHVPVPTSVRSALVAESEGNDAQRALATTVSDGAPATETAAAAGTADDDKPADGSEPRLTLAALFATKRKTPNADPAGKPAPARQARLLTRETAAARQTAALVPTALPGVLSTAAPVDHSELEEDGPDEDDNGVTEIASLAGLARLSPNGLWLQTEKVNTGCFKPELLAVLKSVEQHYGKPVIVTSGVRPMKRNRTKQSLHTRCEAADIQIAGVSRWELAEYLRSRPGRGGVGTYCHTESVHIDIGPERDWNWKCRGRRK